MADSVIHHLIDAFAKLPGIGPRSARRMVLSLIRERNRLLEPLHHTIGQVMEQAVICESCGNIDTTQPCQICSNPKRDPSLICVVEDIADLWAMERSGGFRGHYHVLGGTLSAIDGRGPQQLGIPRLEYRIQQSAPKVEEIIIATNQTVEGQTTAHFLAENLGAMGVNVTRLAQGIPMGGELDYLDEGTLGAAMQSRRAM
jgi:recombination protein RecR